MWCFARCVNQSGVCNRTWTTSLPRSKPGSYLPPRVEVTPTYCVSCRWSCRVVSCVVSCYELNVGAMPRCCHQQKEDQDPVWRGGRPAEPTPLLPPRLAPHRHRGYAPDLLSSESHTAPCNCHQQRRAAPHFCGVNYTGRRARKWADVRSNTVAVSFAFAVKEGVNGKARPPTTTTARLR